MAVVNIAYKVGSRDESPELTGLAHLFEHLMFGGSENVADFDKELQTAGGDSNAWTGDDITNFYDVLPVQNIETAFWIESDRMNRLAFTPSSLEVQRSVVIEEFKERVLNAPYGDLSLIMRQMAFKRHPYRWPVIGLTPEHIAKVEMPQVKDFFYSHYAPNNAILGVVGNVDFSTVVKLAEKWFGSIPVRKVARPEIPVEPVQTSPRCERVNKNVPQNVIEIGYKMCGRLDAGYVASDIVSDVLANGNSSRFYRNLVMDSGLFASADASIWGTFDPGLFIVSGVLMPGVSFEDARNALCNEINELLVNGISEYELEKCVNKWEAREQFACVSSKEVASKLCYYQSIGDAERLNTEIGRYRALTTDDVMDAARAIFNPDAGNTLFFGPDA